MDIDRTVENDSGASLRERIRRTITPVFSKWLDPFGSVELFFSANGCMIFESWICNLPLPDFNCISLQLDKQGDHTLGL